MANRNCVAAIRLGFLAAIAGLLFAGSGPSQAQTPKQAKQAAKLREVDVLRNAYVFMAMSKHDYDGLRVKAMHRVEEAMKALDASVLKKGTNGEKVVALEEEIAEARAKFIAKHTNTAGESQHMSDLQMREAHTLLVNVQTAMTQNRQPKGREHVDEALKLVRTALKIR